MYTCDMKPTLSNAYTLVEFLIVVAVIGIIVSFAVPAFAEARTNAILGQAQAVRSQLNSFAQQIRNEFQSNAGTIGSDKNAALLAYQNMGFLSTSVDISNVDFASGVWVLDPQL